MSNCTTILFTPFLLLKKKKNGIVRQKGGKYSNETLHDVSEEPLAHMLYHLFKGKAHCFTKGHSSLVEHLPCMQNIVTLKSPDKAGEDPCLKSRRAIFSL